MSNLLKELLAEVKAGDGIQKNATAPNESPTVEEQNADILETSQAMIAKIDNFLQQANGGGEDLGGGPNTSAGNPNPVTDGDPTQGAAAGGAPTNSASRLTLLRLVKGLLFFFRCS